MRKKQISPMGIILIILIILGIFYIFSRLFSLNSPQNISNLTNLWIKEVTVNHDPEAIYKLFCPDGTLVGTVSQSLRKNKEIKGYFEYFAKLPGIKVLDKKFNIQKITNNVYLNTAFITWTWDSLEEPIIARMSFIYRDNCIFQLHSSALPDLNEDSRRISPVTKF